MTEYANGCGISYNPDEIIRRLDGIVKEVFLAGGDSSGGTGGSGLLSGLLSFGNKVASIDVERRKKQELLDKAVAPWKAKNQAVAKFLNSAPMEFGGGKPENDNGLQNNSSLSYQQWRETILTSLKRSFIDDDGQIVEELRQDDLYVMEDISLYEGRAALDINKVHVYLHNLQNWNGTGQDLEIDQADRFRVDIQYGNLNARSGKFEVKDFTKDEEVDTVKDGSSEEEKRGKYANLLMGHNFAYIQDFNHLRIKVSTLAGEKVCHCHIDLRGLQRNKFIVIQQVMNSKEFTNNTESAFGLVQCKASVFLQVEKAQLSPDKNQCLQSIRRHSDITLNTNADLDVQKKFQEAMAPALQKAVESDLTNLKSVESVLDDDAAVDAVAHQYKFVDLEPAAQHGDLDPDKFKAVVQDALGELDVMSRNSGSAGIDELITALKKAEKSEIASQRASLLQNKSQPYLSLREFYLQVLFSSPLTIKEKLDVIYDLQNSSNRFVDGIDIQ